MIIELRILLMSLLGGYIIIIHGQSGVWIPPLRAYHQNDYRFLQDRITNIWYNKSIFGHFNAYFFRYNRTIAAKAFNGSFETKTDSSRHIWVRMHCQVYKLSSNEYRLFPINFTVNFCDMLAKNTFGLRNICKNANFTCSCPIKKGWYTVANYWMDQDQLPPYAPRGEFRIDIYVSIKKTAIPVLHFKMYGKVEPVLPWH